MDTLKVGDVVRIKKLTRETLIEVDQIEEDFVSGLIPYSSTYDPDGKYFGSYRGRQSAWLSQIVEIVPKTTLA